MAQFDLGHAWLALGASFALVEQEIQHATFAFKLSISIAPDNPWGHWGLRRVNVKQSIAGQHMYDRAIDCCREALARHPDHPRAHFELGEAYNENYDRFQKQEALAAYRRAVALDPEMIEAHFKIAAIQRVLAQDDDAARTFRIVIALDPASSFARDARRALMHIERRSSP